MSAPTFQSVLDALQGEAARRAQLVAEVAAIDAKFAKVAETFGIAIGDLGLTVAPPKVDGRRAGTMTEFVLKTLEAADFGMTRAQLKEAIRGSTFADQLRKSENGFYNMIQRAIKREEISDLGGTLFVAAKAPEGCDGGE